MNQFEGCLQHEQKKPLDEELFGDLSSIKQLSAYNYFVGTREYRLDEDTLQEGKLLKAGVREKAKHAFLSGVVRNPELTYPRLKDFDAQAVEKQYLALKEKIKKEKNDVLRKVYLWKVNEKIAENRMLQAAKNGDDKKFVRYSTFVYGRPERETFNYTLAKLLVDTERAMRNDDNIIAQEAARRLRDEFKDYLSLADDITLLPQKRKRVGPVEANVFLLRHKDEKFQIPSVSEMEVYNDDREYTDQEIVATFTEALKTYGIEGWDVVIDDTRTAISISDGKVLVPKGRRKESLRTLQGLIAHEIGVHVRRKENGAHSVLKILSIGLDRYKDDEGIAMYEQQKVQGMHDFAGFNTYLAISLALGMDGKKRDFRYVFTIMTDYFLMEGEDYATAQNRAWNMCMRTFRGTTGATPGACFTKDLFYRDNNIGIWYLVKRNDPEVRRFMVGKYDPTNARHIWVLDQLHIGEDDFANLEEKQNDAIFVNP